MAQDRLSTLQPGSGRAQDFRLIAVAMGLMLILGAPRAQAQRCRACGDANGDGRVNIVDALFIAQKTVGLRPVLACPDEANVKEGEELDVVDALFIGQFTVGSRPILCLRLDSPTMGGLFARSPVTLSGRATGPETVTCNHVAAAFDGAVFSADVPLREGRNPVTCVARHPIGAVGETTTQVVLDTTPPRVVIESPPRGFMTTSSQIDITGMIADPASVTVNTSEPTVMVNGVQAQVRNRSFVVPGFLLQPGVNTIAVSSPDQAGNVGSAQINVNLLTETPQRLQEMAGSSQTGTIGDTLADPLVVRLTDRRGTPVAGQKVKFEVTRGAGSVRAFPEQGRSVMVATDENGLASVRFTLGTRVGEGNQQVTASLTGVPGAVVFCASAHGFPPQRIVAVFGGNQTGAVLSVLPLPLITLVTDAGGNPVSGVEVTFEVVQGEGSLAGRMMRTDVTDAEGRASAVLTLGPREGINNNVVNASFGGLAESPATFVASALAPALEPNTTVSGLVLDNQDDPVPGVTATIIGTTLSAVSDAQGRFTISNAPVGAIQLGIDGTTTSRPGTWPVLHFELVTVCGRDNTIGMPIRLLPIDVGGSAIVGGPQDVTIKMAGVPGAELTVLANSVTLPDGSHVGRVSFTQVHSDKVPMIAPLGSNFMLAFTVQPPGTRFDPPARVAIPNTGSLPGTVVEMFSFDHDIGEFVSIGTASVTPDGMQLVSNAGFGITKAGWGGCVPPPPPPDCPNNCNTQPCTILQGKSCVPDPSNRPCEDPDKNDCTEISGTTCPMCQKTEREKCASCGQDNQSVCESKGGKCTKVSRSQFTIKYATWIPGPYIAGPIISPLLQGFCTAIEVDPFTGLPVPIVRRLYFKGDKRSPSSSFAASSRGAQTTALIPEQCVDEDGEVGGSYTPRNDPTRSYASDAVDDGVLDAADEDGVANDCHLFNDSAPAGTATFSHDIMRVGPHKVQVRLHGSPSDPLIFLSPHIDWNLTITIDSTDPDNVRYTIQGTHDGFPDHEIWINSRQVYGFHGTNILALFGSADIKVSKSESL